MRTRKFPRFFTTCLKSIWVGLAAVLLFASSGSGIFVNPIVNGPFVYVGNQGNGTVSVINAGSGTVVATVTLPSCIENCVDNPAGLAVTPDAASVYVTVPNQGYVAVINASTNTVSTTIPLCSDCSSTPVAVAITPGGDRAYVADPGQGDVAVITTTTQTVLTTIGLCECTADPVGLAITPDGTRAYVTDKANSDIYVIDTNPADTAYNTVVATISADVGDPNGAIAITPGGSAAYYPFGTISIGVIDTNPADDSYNTHVATIGVGNAPTGVATTGSASNSFVYVTNSGDNSISVISDATRGVTTTITGVGTTPNQIVISPDGTTAYAAAGGSSNVQAVYTSTNTAQTPIAVGNGPFSIAVGPEPSFEEATLNGSAQTITFPFFNGGASISFTVPAGWCSPAPCTVIATATDEPNATWQSTDSSNYPGTDIAPVAALPGGGMTGGDGVLYSVSCTDNSNNPCAVTSNLNYTANLNWGTETDICGMGPGLGKEETTTWENIFASCSYEPDPAAGISGNSKDGMSRWAAFYGITGPSTASVNITTPANGGSYLLNQTVDANYSCSGTYDECAGTVANGDPINTSAIGTQSFTAEADVTAGPTASQTVTYNVVNCHDVSFAFNPSTVPAGGLTFVTATVKSCTGMAEKKTVVQFVLTGPFGRNCGTSQTLIFQTPSFTLGASTNTFLFPLLIPRGSCAGTYTVTANTSVAGTLVDSSSTSLIVTSH
ncbi:MAG TPA: YncE family protein [Candidatus Acidoferrum sp.]|nr:YncE family protein [Candidatus Acidoferrum sp.]